MTEHRIESGLKWLASEASASREEFRLGNAPDGDELLDGLRSQGYVRERGGRFAVNDVGFRRLEASGG